MFNHSARKARGYAVWHNPDNKTIEKDTMQCVHCGGHFVVEAGSGTKRGFCVNCNGVTCGKVECQTCIPFMKKIEEQERRSLQLKSILGI